MFVEKTDVFFWEMYFLVERSCCKKSFLEKEIDFLESYVYFLWKPLWKRIIILSFED